MPTLSRKEALGAGALAIGAAAGALGEPAAPTVRVGVVGVGGRGSGLLGMMLQMPDVVVPALCDIDRARLDAAQAMVAASGRPRPIGYSSGDEAYRQMMERDDLDAVVIATPWNWHTPMAVRAMERGIYAAVEVPCSLSVAECWELVNTSEKTGVPCMMLENWSFRRDNLAVLQMIRKGLLGEMVHCHCAHSHDCIDHWFFDPQGVDRWPARFLVEHNRDQYPTHSLGPVLSWMDINCGDVFASVTSTATDSRAINAYFARRFGPEHPGAKRRYKQGDIVTSVIRTALGKSVVVNFDMQLPRPYDNRWMVQGTLGVYDEDQKSVYITGRSPAYHQWEPFEPYQSEFDHPWWRSGGAPAAAAHGGTDSLELRLFLNSVKARIQTPIDVYDSVTMSALVALSGESIARKSAPVKWPDFTRGKWKQRKPAFGLV
jgi:predicted dehydrogenase